MTTKRKVSYAALFGVAFIGAWWASDIGVRVGNDFVFCIYWTPFSEVYRPPSTVAYQTYHCPALKSLSHR